MEFDKSRCYSALNADKLSVGDKVIVAYDLAVLKRCVKDNNPIDTLCRIGEEEYMFRFGVKGNCAAFALAYLVERAKTENRCAICAKSKNGGRGVCVLEEGYGCDKYEKKTEPHYRPFKNTDELIKVWEQKWSEKTNGQKWHDCKLNMPHIWIRRKNDPKDKGRLIIAFNDDCVEIGEAGSGDVLAMDGLFEIFEFLDGSPCGVEE